MTKFCCISDIHENYDIDIPDCDFLLIAGDIFSNPKINSQLFWMQNFRVFISEIEKRQIKWLMTPGNHDSIFEQCSYHLVSDKIKMNTLIDEYKDIEFAGLDEETKPRFRVYGSPWQKRFFDWSFNLDEPDLERKWSMIPDNTEILLLHSPPYGILDNKLGSPSLTKRIQELPNLKLCVYGHIHVGYGHKMINGIHFVNASLCNDNNKIVNKPIMIEL